VLKIFVLEKMCLKTGKNVLKNVKKLLKNVKKIKNWKKCA